MNFRKESMIDELADEVGKKSTYLAMKIPRATLIDLAAKALSRQPSRQLALKAVRRKLHQIVAPYLGDPDYQKAVADLRKAFGSVNSEDVVQCCRNILSSHTSTRERLQILEEFYPQIFSVTGSPDIVLDLACGLNPLALRWMHLTPDCQYLAYDIHAPRLELIRTYFQMEGMHGRVFLQDVLVEPPQVIADVAFLFKEAHRFEEREKGCNRELWKALQVRYLCVSLPPISMTGRHDLADRNRHLVSDIVKGENWSMQEIDFSNEQVFIIRKR